MAVEGPNARRAEFHNSMKPTAGVALLVLAFCMGQNLAAQGTLHISNLNRSPGDRLPVASDSQLAQPFRTGESPNGFTLSAVEVRLGSSAGTPTGFRISVYSSLEPAVSLGTLSGPDPMGGGLYTFSSQGILLSPASEFFVVLSATTPASVGSYSWRTTSSGSDPNWSIAPWHCVSVDGSDWAVSYRGEFQLGITATAVPEPSVLCLAVLGLGGLAWRWRARRHGRW